jgi:coenzyme PQQ precursor peptide PqqA
MLYLPSGGVAGTLGDPMEWTAPAFEEVCLNCEINSYASAKL